MAAVSSGNMARKTLTDISNLPVQQLVRDGKSRSSTTLKDYEQLLKEKMQLLKILADRQKIIEVTGIELQKLRMNQQKMQEQNKLLAQSNRQLLAEINANSEKVKALNHDLGCKNGLLKALQHELKSQVKVNVAEEEVKLTGIEDQEVAARGQDADKQDTSSRRIYSKSLGPSLHVQSKEKAGNKRACVRRQSARFKSEEAESTYGLCQIPDTKFAVCPLPTDSVLEDSEVSRLIMMKDEDKEGNSTISHKQGRPSEVAAKKVQSYKEISPRHRPSIRRQSARLKSEEAESSRYSCGIPETKLMVCPPPTASDLEDGVASTITTAKDEDKEGNAAISFCVNEDKVKLTETELLGELDTTEKEKAGNKRACVRRPFARLNSEEAESTDELCEIPENQFAVCLPPTETVLEDGVASMLTKVKNDKEGNAAIRHEQGRPSRAAAKKVQSYKEIPLKVKMRRPD